MVTDEEIASGAALIGAAYILSGSGGNNDSYSGGGLGQTIREQVQIIRDRVKAIPTDINYDTSDFIPDFDRPDWLNRDGNNNNGGGLFGGLFDFETPKLPELPTGPELFDKSSAAGQASGASIGGALGSAFIGLYEGAITAGARAAGRDDVTYQNAFEEFGKASENTQNRIKDTAENTQKRITNAAAGIYNASPTGQAINAIKDISSGDSGGGGSGGIGTARIISAATNPITGPATIAAIAAGPARDAIKSISDNLKIDKNNDRDKNIKWGGSAISSFLRGD